jgi:hypothetical protein
MSLHRSVVAAALAATLLTAGCSDDSSADPTPVTAGPTTAVDPTTTAGIETTTTVAEAATSTTSAAPPVTKPLTTAPPSELLAEVTAAYDAAYADLLAAEAIPDENYAGLENHMSSGQAEQWRSVIRRLRENGQRVVPGSGGWVRVESIDQPSDALVRLTVCRLDTERSVDASGTPVATSSRAARYVEEFQMTGGGWIWSGREWVDPSPDYSDCALP